MEKSIGINPSTFNNITSVWGWRSRSPLVNYRWKNVFQAKRIWNILLMSDGNSKINAPSQEGLNMHIFMSFQLLVPFCNLVHQLTGWCYPHLKKIFLYSYADSHVNHLWKNNKTTHLKVCLLIFLVMLNPIKLKTRLIAMYISWVSK